MPEEQRQVILLVGLEGMEYAGAAEILNAPIGTIRSRLSRGRDALRKLMGMGEKATGVSSGFNKSLPKETVIPPRALAP